MTLGLGWLRVASATTITRPLRDADAAEAARLHAEHFAHSWGQAEFLRLLGDPLTVADAANENPGGALAGFCLSRLLDEDAELMSLVVARAVRRRGVGQAILSAHLSRLAARGGRRVFLEVEDGNAAARALYARFGFSQVGERVGYYRLADGRRATALVLQRPLG